jgi:hypothetical protein
MDAPAWMRQVHLVGDAMRASDHPPSSGVLMRSVAFSSALLLAFMLAACGDDSTGAGGSPGSGGGDGTGGSGEGGAAAQTTATAGTTSATTATTATTGTTSGGGGQGGEGEGGDGQGGEGPGGAGGEGQGGAGGEGQGGAGGEGQGGAEPFVNPCPGQFTCSDGACVPFTAFCTGVDDCADGEDEDPDACTGLLDGSAICDSGLSFGDDQSADEASNLCAGAACCDEFRACTDGGADVDACIACFQAGGGAACDDAQACLDANCFGGSGVCDANVTFGDIEVDACASQGCCEEFQACVGSGSDEDVTACVDCFLAGGTDALCAPAQQCMDETCPPEGDALGVCASGITTNDASDDECLSDFCCLEFETCTSEGADIDACIDCFLGGGGELCDDALECADTLCP